MGLQEDPSDIASRANIHEASCGNQVQEGYSVLPNETN